MPSIPTDPYLDLKETIRSYLFQMAKRIDQLHHYKDNTTMLLFTLQTNLLFSRYCLKTNRIPHKAIRRLHDDYYCGVANLKRGLIFDECAYLNQLYELILSFSKSGNKK